MENYIYYNSLFDVYGELLTKKEQEAFHDYYQEDFSLSEIAAQNNISRSAVQKTIKNVLEKLDYYEDKLHIVSKNEKIYKLLDSNDIDFKEKIKEIMNM